MNKKGILLCGHGTRLAEGAENFKAFAKGFQTQIEGYETASAFLELCEPDFDAGVKELADKGVTEIIALPLFLFTGVHIQKDIPCMLYQAAKKHNVTIKMGNYMGVCEEMVTIAENLIRKAVPAEMLENPKEVALVVAGVGSSKVQANADLSALVRLVQERIRLPFSTIGFLSKMTFPPLKETFKNVGYLPQKNIIVLPYFFFTGIYMNRAEMAIKKFEKNNPDKKVYCTDLLASNQDLYDLLKKRMQEVLSGKVDCIGAMSAEELENYHGHSHCGGGHHHHHHHHDHDDHHHGNCKH